MFLGWREREKERERERERERWREGEREEGGGEQARMNAMFTPHVSD